MPRTARRAPGGDVYHVLNRGTGRMTLFDGPEDFAAFCRVFRDTHEIGNRVRHD